VAPGAQRKSINGMSTLPAPIPHQQAQQQLLEMAAPLGTENLEVENAVGRYLGQSLNARRTQPAADLSAMDGYAVRADELSGPWKVIGESAAGHPFNGYLGPGEAVRISTGALMPQCGGGVLLQVNAVRQGAQLRLSGNDGATPRHIRRAGLDFREGDSLLAAGVKIGPAQIALALSGGHASLAVCRKPRIAIIDNGDELAAAPTHMAAHQIPASNGAMLAAMAQPYVGKCQRLGPVADNLEALAAALTQADDAEVVVTSGGASVGDHDLVRPALEAWGAKIAFWRIAMKPGKPLMVARRGHQFIIGLPGNPVSSYVTAFLFLLPLLRRLGGAAQPLPGTLTLPLSDRLAATGNRAEFVRAQIRQSQVALLGQQDSSALAGLNAAEALIARPANAAEAQPGEPVETYLL